MSAPDTCGRCAIQERPDRLRMALVNLEREAREEGRRLTGAPYYVVDVRCRDRAACLARVMAQSSSPRGDAS